ncbi:MAG: ATP-binding cassette domain-containing protein [Pseudomonadota bacterium]|nr:ATP-binding cassette domain-containing protein [Pseudomonadota bacterium]
MIRLENIFIKTDENKNLISDVNIFIPSGSIISITGVPGSGKTKLFQVMGLQNKSNKGNLFILGKNINKLNRNELSDLHSEISLVCDNNDLIDTLGVEENIIFPLILTNKSKYEIDIAVNELVSWLNISSVLEKNTFDLSNYEKKMVQFARAVIIRPRILLLDNFFIGLSDDYEKKISYLLLALKKIGTTIISFRSKNNDETLIFDENYEIKNSLLEKL